MVEKSLLRTLANLEDQTGCVAQVLVASVDPAGGKLSVVKCVFLMAIFDFTAYSYVRLLGFVKGRPRMD